MTDKVLDVEKRLGPEKGPEKEREGCGEDEEGKTRGRGFEEVVGVKKDFVGKGDNEPKGDYGQDEDGVDLHVESDCRQEGS